MTNQLIPNKITLVVGIILIGLIFYFQDSIPDDVQGFEVPQIEIPEIVPNPTAKETGEIIAEFTSKDQEIIDEFFEEPSKEINLGDFTETVSNPETIPLFKTFQEEIIWYAENTESRTDYPELVDVPHQCDPLIKVYKGTADFDLKVHLAKDILEVCEF